VWNLNSIWIWKGEIVQYKKNKNWNELNQNNKYIDEIKIKKVTQHWLNMWQLI